MRSGWRTVILLSLMVGTWLPIGCSDEATGPDRNGATANATKYMWSRRFGDGYSQYPGALAIDASGNVLLAGYFDGVLDFGGGALASAGNLDIFVAKLRFDGSNFWSKSFGDGLRQVATSVAADPLGNVLIAGYFAGAVDFGGGALTSQGEDDIFLAKFSPAGAYLWSKRFGDWETQLATSVAVDASGNVFVAGYFDGVVDFGGGALTSHGQWDICLAKFSRDGAHLWSKRFGEGGSQEATGIAIDASGNVIVTGAFEGVVDFGGGALTSAGREDIFVAKFGSDGTHLWSKRFGDADSQKVNSVAVDHSGNVLLAGYLWGTVDFGGGALTSAGDRDAFVAKLAPDGTHLWSKSFGDAYWQEATSVAVDHSGNLLVAGFFRGDVSFGGDVLHGSDFDVFLARFSPSGTHLWSARFGDMSDQYAKSVATDAWGNALVAGYFAGTMDFGGGPLTSAGSYDIFLAKFGR